MQPLKIQITTRCNELVRLTLTGLFLALGLTSPLLGLEGSWVAVPKGSPGGSADFGFLVYQPADVASRSDLPLMIFLHGIGERGNGTGTTTSGDLAKVTANGPPRLIKNGVDFPAIVVCPQTSSTENWNPTFLHKVVTQTLARYASRIDEDAVVLTGLSMGGQGAGHYALLHPDTFAALALVDASGNPMPPTAASFDGLPVWLFHGWNDPAKGQSRLWHRAIVNERFGTTFTDLQLAALGLNVQESFQALAGNTANHTAGLLAGANAASSSLRWTAGVQPDGNNHPFVTYYPNHGHNSWNSAYGTSSANTNWALFNWLFAQRRGAGGAGNQPPAVNSPLPDRTATVGDAVSFAIPGSTFSDPDGDTLTIVVSGLPSGLSFAAGTVSGTPNAAGNVTVTVTASDPDGLQATDLFEFTIISAGAGPFYGDSIALPARIQAVDFDTGGQGVAYSDSDVSNSGGNYRPTEGVDIFPSTDPEGGSTWMVSSIVANEWLRYSVIGTAGAWQGRFRVATNSTGTSIQIRVGGVEIGSVELPATGGSGSWVTVVTPDVILPAGETQVELRFTGTSFNARLGWFEMVAGGQRVIHLTFSNSLGPLEGIVAERTELGGSPEDPTPIETTDASGIAGPFTALPALVQIYRFASSIVVTGRNRAVSGQP